MVLLGPSGCGKTTLLRMIAGLEYPDSGEIRIGATGDSSNTTHRESIAMVFQNFALYPHMTVFQNIAFPLNEAAEMGRRSYVSNSTCWGISLAFEAICKAVDVWSTDSTAQTPQRLRRGEVLV